MGRQRLMMSKSISNMFLLGEILAQATPKEKEWSQQNQLWPNPFVRIIMMNDNSMPHLLNVQEFF